MRPSLSSFLAAASIVSTISTECANHGIADLVMRTACGSSESISKCIDQVEVFRLEEIAPCFISSGCKKDDAVWFMQECNMPALEQDLKKRATSTDNKDSTTAATTDKTTAKSSATSKPSTTAPSSTAASTTKDSSTATTVTSTTATSSTATTASSTSSTSASSTASSSSASTTGSSSSGLVCSTTKTISTSACSTTGKSKTCSDITLVTATCAAGLLCFPTMGPNLCMQRDTPLTTSGIVVSAGFGAAITGVILGLIIMCLKARSKQAADERERELMLAGLGKKSARNDVESTPYKFGGGGVSESNVPLVTPGGLRSDQMGHQQEYSSQEYHDQAVPQIQLHPGVTALGQEENPHWSQDYNARRE